MRAFKSSCWCCSRFISMRVLFQIFSGAATDISVAITTSASHQSQCESTAKSHFGLVASTRATRPSSRPTHAPKGAISHDNSALRNSRMVAFGMFKNVNGPKFQRSSLLGIACRINPSSNPAVDAAGIASHSCEISAGIMNSISFSFWSGSRSSVKSTRRKVFHRASSAAMDDATPTFSSRVNSRSRTEVAVSIFACASQLTLAFPRLPVKGRAPLRLRKFPSQPQMLGALSLRTLHVSAASALKSFFVLFRNCWPVLRACYTSRFPMSAKSKQGKKPNRKAAGLRMVAHAALPTRFGRFTICGFRGRGPQEEAVALVRGNLNGKAAPLVRVHSQCLTGDVLTSLRCDCRAQLELSMKKIAQAASGILLYLPQEGRGIGLMNKLRAYELQDGGMDTVEANETLGFAADARDYEFSAKILKKLGAKKIRLLSNNPEKVRQLENFGIRVVERVPCQPRISKISRAYLKTKKRKMGHLLEGI